MPRRSPALGRAAIFAALALGTTGCATKFVAKAVNPLKRPPTPAWDPGEISPSTAAILRSMGKTEAWRANPFALIRELDAEIARGVPGRRRVAIEVTMAAGIHAQARVFTDRGAAGLYLYAAELASVAVGEGSAEDREVARVASRFALSRLIGLRDIALREEHFDWTPDIQGPTKAYHIAIRGNVPASVSPDRFSRIVPVDRFTIQGARDLAIVEGYGAPLIGKVKGARGAKAADTMTVEDGTWLPLTATIDFAKAAGESRATITIYDRKRTETAVGSRRGEVLAADFSTPFAVRMRELNQQNFFTLGLLGFLRGDRWFDATGLYPLEFPSTDKIPVVFVHGLISDPSDWRFLHNSLLADSELRKRYQFWAFHYPTSLAVPWSATKLRQAFAREHALLNPGGRNPALSRMVVIGHSMGGLLTRMQIVSEGEAIYHRYFTKPPEKLRLSANEQKFMRDMFFFEPNPDIDKTIFICVPHQGSDLAVNWVGRIGRGLARLPFTVVELSTHIITFNADALRQDVQLDPETSIDSLSPGGGFARMLSQLPMSPRVKKYSIIGDRGRGGDLWQSSDGVVPYWSSHLEGVPESIIPSNHSGPEHPECADRVKEILRK